MGYKKNVVSEASIKDRDKKLHPTVSVRYKYSFLPLIPVSDRTFLHWNGNVFILTKSSSLAAPKVVKMTTFGAASDEDFIKMTTFSFQCHTCTVPTTYWYLNPTQGDIKGFVANKLKRINQSPVHFYSRPSADVFL